MKQIKGFFNKKSDISLSQDTTKPQSQANLTPKPSHKKLKIFGATTLAVFMSATALFAFLPLTQTKISARPINPTAEAVKLTPETDPTVFTTDDGLEIKSHTVSATGSESTIQYFTLGSYNGTPVNWLIVGTSSAGISTNSSPAGTAIKNETEKQKLVTGAISSDLLENQILCMSEYAFNQENHTALYTVNGTRYCTASSNSFSWGYSTTDQFSDYCSGYTDVLPDTVAKSLDFGTILSINQYYNYGQIVTNAYFSDNYIFSLSSTLYLNFVEFTSFSIPYLFTNQNEATPIWTSDISRKHTVTSSCSYSGGNYIYSISGIGKAQADCANVVLSTGLVGDIRLADFVGTPTSLSTSIKYTSHNRYYDYNTSYSVTNHTITLAYRPAFVWQL